ncbi:MAG: hypothetical protein ACYTGQ_15560 [Planctomycetota bacterium]|jgi:hypothetical protein
MRVDRQTCQNCGSIDVRNILSRKLDQPTIVYVRCAKCFELVAYYELSQYYHHGKGIESFLKAQGVKSNDSAHRWLTDFNQIQKDATTGFKKALEQLDGQQKDV